MEIRCRRGGDVAAVGEEEIEHLARGLLLDVDGDRVLLGR